MSVLRGGRSPPFSLPCVLVFAGSASASYAANGGPLRLGQSNSASKTTTLQNTGNGAALSSEEQARQGAVQGVEQEGQGQEAERRRGRRPPGGKALQTKSYRFTLSGATNDDRFSVRFALDGRPVGEVPGDLQRSRSRRPAAPPASGASCSRPRPACPATVPAISMVVAEHRRVPTS